jgi:flagellar biosynthesis protein FlhB
MFFYYFHRFFFLLLEEKMGKKTEIPTKEKYKMKNSGIVLFSQETTRSVSSPQ